MVHGLDNQQYTTDRGSTINTENLADNENVNYYVLWKYEYYSNILNELAIKNGQRHWGRYEEFVKAYLPIGLRSIKLLS